MAQRSGGSAARNSARPRSAPRPRRPASPPRSAHAPPRRIDARQVQPPDRLDRLNPVEWSAGTPRRPAPAARPGGPGAFGGRDGTEDRPVHVEQETAKGAGRQGRGHRLRVSSPGTRRRRCGRRYCRWVGLQVVGPGMDDDRRAVRIEQPAMVAPGSTMPSVPRPSLPTVMLGMSPSCGPCGFMLPCWRWVGSNGHRGREVRRVAATTVWICTPCMPAGTFIASRVMRRPQRPRSRWRGPHPSRCRYAGSRSRWRPRG